MLNRCYQRFHDDAVFCAGMIAALACLLPAAAVFLSSPYVVQNVYQPVLEILRLWIGPEAPQVAFQYDAAVRRSMELFALGAVVLGWTLAWRLVPPAPGTAPKEPGRPVRRTCTRLEITAIAIICLLGLAVRFPGLERSLYYDEICTALHFIDTESIRETVSANLVFNNHIAYSLAARLSQNLFGKSEWALRLPALLFGLGGIAFLWYYAGRTAGAFFGIVCAALLSVYPLHVVWSVSARGYSAMVLFWLLSSFFYLDLLKKPGRLTAGCYVGATALGAYFHLYNILIVPTQAVHLLCVATYQRLRPAGTQHLSAASFRLLWLLLFAACGCVLVLYAPLIKYYYAMVQSQAGSSFDPLFPLELARRLSSAGSTPINTIIFILSAAGAFRVWKNDRMLGSYISCVFLIPLAVAWLLKPEILGARFFSFLSPFYILLCVHGMLWAASLIARTAGKKVVFAISALPLIALMLVWADGSRHALSIQEGFKDAGREMQARSRDDTFLCTFGFGSGLIQYYVQQPVAVLKSLQQFKEASRDREKIICAQRISSRNTPGEKELADYLSQRAAAKEFQNIRLFFMTQKH